MACGEVWNGRYRIERVLGAGGVSRVYQACDLLREQLGEPDPWVAVKVLSDDLAKAPDASVLLYREFSLTLRLHHPHVVRALQFDVDTANHRAFIVLELMRGLTLDRLLRERSEGLPWGELREIVVQLLNALAYLHERGVVHGDLKPSNAMLSDQGLRLFDFGLSEASGEVSTAVPSLDRSRIDAWTPAYAAPELLESGQLTASCDVYAVACLIYELASGSHPFLRLDALKARAERLDRALRMPSSLPPSCHATLARAMAFDIQERCVDARQLYRVFLDSPRGSSWQWF